ncbi:undecaprenyldiphospho-muramoylpentapeptide beta-N-acetylglucosaminyltransferase [Aquisalimonas sp.]|uniref:undecaprenyldiphospho-muramoylpentapeptide beta-N-acetylglucosaminyltransferase n=1 Tax=unclassified Aquisalimonas TaxID=2644645 RepID=UPI0025C19662|nr:undecaprenyldiphospho-muramoylpentapeptide beta-N-acetylglucosaminyltransferase [Aquisalimonas sp.]
MTRAVAETPVLIMAGGTGGHVFPALAVADALRARGVPVIWLGTRKGLESRVVPEAGLVLEWLTVQGLRGNGALGWVLAPVRVLRAVLQAARVVRRHRPRAVLGMGGYVAGPGGLAAWLLRCPLIIHEQNAVAGMTNRLLARLARRVLAGFPGAFAGDRAEVTGNPVRGAILRLPPPEERPQGREPWRLLVVGGSLGAKVLNEVVPQALALMPESERPVVVHQAGEVTGELARSEYAGLGVSAEVTPFIADMATAYGEADLVVCRAGALTVSELSIAGVASVLVPLPHAVDDHQTANAMQLAECGAAELMPQSELTAERLAAFFRSVAQDRARLIDMGQAARGLARPDAAETVAERCLEVAR